MSAENSVEVVNNLRCVHCGSAMYKEDPSDAFFICKGTHLIKIAGIKLFFRKHPPFLVSSKFAYSPDGKLNGGQPNVKIDGNLGM